MAVSTTETIEMKPFPPGRRGVMLPVNSRAAAALGVCMYTAAKPRVLLAQRGAYVLTRMFGTRTIPTKVVHWQPPYQHEVWREFRMQLRELFGPFDALAVYERRQLDRPGLTLLLTQGSRAIAIVKVRPEPDQLKVEQDALQSVRASGPSQFQVPAPLGLGSVTEDVHWSAQQCVFTKPHAPQLKASPQLFDEVTKGLSHLKPIDSDLTAAHNDLTPWNLRVDRKGTTWLFDWEDAGPAPIGSDLTYFSIAVHALRGTDIPPGLPGPAVRHWREIVASRTITNQGDAVLSERLLAGLDQSGN